MIFVSFFQLAQDEGSPVRGFGVVEYESAEQAEAVLIEMDRTLVGGQEVRLSLCTPGTSGRSTLAALIAAQGMVSMVRARAAQSMVSQAHTHKPINTSGRTLQAESICSSDVRMLTHGSKLWSQCTPGFTIINLQDHWSVESCINDINNNKMFKMFWAIVDAAVRSLSGSGAALDICCRKYRMYCRL